MKYYKMREAAKLLGIQVRTLREWIKLGKIKTEKASNDWYWIISEQEIAKHVNKNGESSE